MCGIAGFLSFRPEFDASSYVPVLNQMGNSLQRRGPDSSGIWTGKEPAIGFIHRRLSVIDLSEAGNQPMVSPSGRFVIAYNGEIYNHLQIRKELADSVLHEIHWRGHSDTETLLMAIEIWGLDKSLSSMVGMFAFALWDRETVELMLVRDRIGEKPLYFGLCNDALVFASELAAFNAFPGFSAELDRDSIALFLKYSNVPAPNSIYKGIFKLVPGTYLRIASNLDLTNQITYWSAKDVVRSGGDSPFEGSKQEAVYELKRLLHRSVGQQMLADVPLGAFLSGGIDSSTIVALMQSQSKYPVKTFSIGFSEESFDEAKYAHQVANHLHTEHTELYVSAAQAQDVIPKLPSIYSEPFADVSQIPTFLVSHLAKQHVTVSLSGDGGDELFGGYNRYLQGSKWWPVLSKLPASIRRAMAAALLSIPPKLWDSFFYQIEKKVLKKPRHTVNGDRIHKGARVLCAKSPLNLYELLVSQWLEEEDMVIGASHTVMNRGLGAQGEVVQIMMERDLLGYLPDDILTKVDRAAMSASLETRIPMLDHRIVEFAWQLPLEYKLNNGIGKWVLREVLNEYVPKSLTERPKMGFGVPIADWLRGHLRDWAEELLSYERLQRDGIFRPEPIRKRWQEHLSGTRNWQDALWSVLMFQAWLQHNRR